MRKLALAILLVAPVALAKSYTDNKQTVTHDCGKDASATFNGNDGTYTLTGKCDEVKVVGNRNKVTIESAKTVQVTGNENTVAVDATDAVRTSGSKNNVTWKKGLSSDKPGVSNPGKDNNIGKQP